MSGKNSKSPVKKRHEFFLSIFEGRFFDYLNKQNFEEFLNGMLDYFSENKNENNFNLIINVNETLNETLRANYSNKYTNILNYLNQGLNNIKNNLPLDNNILVRRFNLLIRTNIQELYTDNTNSHEFYELIFSSINVTKNAIQFSRPDRKKTPVNDTVFMYLFSEVSYFGKLVLDLRKKDQEHNSIAMDVVNLIKNSTEYLTKDQVKQIYYAYISKFHFGMDDIEEACKEFFGTDDCYYPESAAEQYFAIKNGRFPLNTSKAYEVSKELYSHTRTMHSESIVHDETELVNFLKYFTDDVTAKNSHHSGISDDMVDYLSLWINTLPNNFKAINPSLKFYTLLYDLVKNVIADPHFNARKFHLIKIAIETCLDFMNELVTQGSDYDYVVKSFASLFNQIYNKEQIPIEFKLEYVEELTQIGLNCLQAAACNASLVLGEFTEVFGLLIHNTKKIEINKIEEATQQLVNNATHIIPALRLKEIGINFIKQYTDGTQITEKCARLFNFTGCQALTTIDPIIPDTITAIPPANTTLAPAINQTSSPILANKTDTELPVTLNTTAIDYANNDTITNQTNPHSTEQNTVPSIIPSTTEITTSLAHGVGSGLINAIAQGLSMWLREKGYGKSTLSALSLSLASSILQASYMTTFPLMLSKLNTLVAEGNEEEAQAQWGIMTTMLPPFFTTLGLSLGLQLLNYLSKNYLSKQPTLKGLVQSIPTVASLWSLSRNLIPTLINLGTSYVVSTISLIGFNRFLSVRNQQHRIDTFNPKVTYHVENDDIESKKFLNDQKSESPTKVNKKKYNFITENKLNLIRAYLNILVIHLSGVYSIYQKQIELLNSINSQESEIKSLRTKYSNFLENIESNLKSILITWLELGMLTIPNFQEISYTQAIQTAKENLNTIFANNVTEDGKLGLGIKLDENLADNSDAGLNGYSVFLSKFISDFLKEEEKGCLAKFYDNHNKACKDFNTETELAEDKEVGKFHLRTMQTKQLLERFKVSLLQIIGLPNESSRLHESALPEINQIQFYLDRILEEFKQIESQYSLIMQQKKHPSSQNTTNGDSKHLRENPINKSCRPITIHGNNISFHRISSGDESTTSNKSTSSGSSKVNSECDNAEYQEQRYLINPTFKAL